MALTRTLECRPDLIETATLDNEEQALLEEIKRERGAGEAAPHVRGSDS